MRTWLVETEEQGDLPEGVYVRWGNGRWVLVKATRDVEAKDVLRGFMSWLSEDCWCASWDIGMPYSLWYMLTKRSGYNGPVSWGMGEVSSDDLDALLRLHEDADGWWVWLEGDVDPRFLTTDEWLDHLAARQSPAGA